MASGRLGAATLAATIPTNVYTCPAATVTTCNVSICNTNATPVTVRLAITPTSANPSAGEYLEYGATVAANGVLERTGIVLDATNKYLVGYASGTGVNFVVYGFEESA